MPVEDVVEGVEALTEAEPAYRRAEGYYDGTVGEVFASRRLARAFGSDRFRVNVIADVVDSVADRLELLPLRVDNDEAAQAALERAWSANGLDVEANAVMRKACTFGDAFVMVWEGEEEADPAVVNYLSPYSCRVVYDRDNPRRARYAVHQWPERGPLGEKTTRVNLLYADRIEKWRTRPGTKPGEAAAWEPVVDPETGEPDVVDNPHGRVPVFHFRSATPYGEPEHARGYGAQDAVTKIVATHLGSVDYLGLPQRYALAAADEVDDDLDLDDDVDFYGGDGDGEEREESRDRAGLKSEPGGVWWLKGVSEVGQFDPADAEAFLKPAVFYVRMIGQTTKTPLHLLDESGGDLSGEARRRREGPHTKKVRDRAKMFAATWAELAAFVLRVEGFPDRKVRVDFAPPEVVADAEGWSTVQAKVDAGVPVRVALIEAGYTSDEVDKWYPEGEENSLRVVDLVAVADVLQKLGAAVTLGIITEEEARALLPEGILGDPAADVPPVAAPPLPVSGGDELTGA